LAYAKTTVESGRLDSTGQPVDTVKVGAKSAGSLMIEWAPVTFDPFLEAAFRGTFANVVNSTGAVVIAASARTLTLAGAFTDAVAGQWVLLSAFVAGESYPGAGDSANNGWWKIESVTSDEVVVLADPSGRLVDETATEGIVKSRRLLNGLRKISYAVEVTLTDAQTYFAYLGQHVSTLAMTLSAGAIVTGEVGFVGSDVLDEQGVQEFTGAVSVAATSRTITATGAFERAAAGQSITLSGLANTGNNVTGKIATVISDDAVTLTAATAALVDENLAVSYTGVVTVTAAGRHVTATGAFKGVAAGRSITISGMTTAGNNVMGVVATAVSNDEVTLTSATTTLVNETGPGTAHIVSAKAANGASIVGAAPSWSATGSYIAETETGALNATSNVGDIYIDGALSNACFKALNWTLTNNLREVPCIGDEFPRIDYGTPALTGSFERLYTDIDLWRKMRNHETIAVEFGVVGADVSTGIHISVPEARINTNPIDLSGGNNTDVVDKVDWSASKHTNAASETYYVQVCVA
jgi:hypothetical protein